MYIFEEKKYSDIFPSHLVLQPILLTFPLFFKKANKSLIKFVECDSTNAPGLFFQNVISIYVDI